MQLFLQARSLECFVDHRGKEEPSIRCTETSRATGRGHSLQSFNMQDILPRSNAVLVSLPQQEATASISARPQGIYLQCVVASQPTGQLEPWNLQHWRSSTGWTKYFPLSACTGSVWEGAACPHCNPPVLQTQEGEGQPHLATSSHKCFAGKEQSPGNQTLQRWLTIPSLALMPDSNTPGNQIASKTFSGYKIWIL